MNNMVDIKKLQEKFFTDPDWKMMEELILGYINPLLEMNDLDTTQPSENVKAEVIGRLKAYEGLRKFLDDSKIVSKQLPTSKNTFK